MILTQGSHLIKSEVETEGQEKKHFTNLSVNWRTGPGAPCKEPCQMVSVLFWGTDDLVFLFLSLWPLHYHFQWTHYQKEEDEMGQTYDPSSRDLPCKQGYFYWLIQMSHPPIVFICWNSQNDTLLSARPLWGGTLRRQVISWSQPFCLSCPKSHASCSFCLHT